MSDDDTPSTPRRGRTPARRRKDGSPSRRGGDRHSEQARLEAIARTVKVVELRKAGMDFATIAERVGYADGSGAHAAWKAALAQAVVQPTTEAVQLMESRYDDMLLAVWPKVRAGNLAAIETALAVTRQMRQLRGMDSAVKLDLTSRQEAQTEVAAVVSELVAMLGRAGKP